MRRVADPNGREWKVGRQWLPKRVFRRDGDVGQVDGELPSDDGGLLSSVGDLFGIDDAGAGIFVVLALIGVVVLLVSVVFPIIVLTIELLLLLVLFFAGLVGRIVFRRPWHVVARSGRQRYRWAVKGWRASGEKRDAVAAELAAGRVPSDAEVLLR